MKIVGETEYTKSVGISGLEVASIGRRFTRYPEDGSVLILVKDLDGGLAGPYCVFEKDLQDMEWTKADPALIGHEAVFHGVKDRVIQITGVSADLRYYWSFDEIFPSFQVIPVG